MSGDLSCPKIGWERFFVVGGAGGPPLFSLQTGQC
jgi:hypothetical protein